MTAFKVRNDNNRNVEFNFASLQDADAFLAYFGTHWVMVRPTLGAMTLTPDIRSNLERLGFGKGCTEKIAAIKFLRGMTGQGLKETKDFCEQNLW